VQRLPGHAELLGHHFPRDTGVIQKSDRAHLESFTRIGESLKLTKGALFRNVGDV
jgi:hypothetical protein